MIFFINEKYNIFIFFKVQSEGGLTKISDNKNSPEMNDSEVDPAARKNPDEKYYFFVEKS